MNCLKNKHLLLYKCFLYLIVNPILRRFFFSKHLQYFVFLNICTLFSRRIFHFFFPFCEPWTFNSCKTMRSNRKDARRMRASLKLLWAEREVQNTLQNPRAYFKPIIRLTLSPSWDFFQTESFLVTGPCREDHVSWKDARCPTTS